MLDYYTDILGFELVERTAERSYLRIGVDQFVIALHKADGQNGLRHVGFQIDPTHTVADAVEILSATGIAARVERDIHPGIPEVVSFSDCEGMRVELYGAVSHPSKVPKSIAIAPRKLG